MSILVDTDHMNKDIFAGGELYEMWGWACGHRGCKATLRHRREEIVRRLAREHQVEIHPELTGQMSLLDVAEA